MSPERELKPKDILIVDDDRDLADLVGFILTNEGYKVRICYSPQDALKEAKYPRPDLIISDVRMPKMWGPEMFRILDQDEETRGIPAILMSATDRLRIDRERTIFLPKPFDNDRFVKTVVAQLK